MFQSPVVPEGFVLVGFAPCDVAGNCTDVFWCDAGSLNTPEHACRMAQASCTEDEQTRPIFLGLVVTEQTDA